MTTIVSKAAAARIINCDPRSIAYIFPIEENKLYKAVFLNQDIPEQIISYQRLWRDFHECRSGKGYALWIHKKVEQREYDAKAWEEEEAQATAETKDTYTFWEVKSQHNKGESYAVYKDVAGNLNCDCQDFKGQAEDAETFKTPFCKHTWAVLFFLGFRNFAQFNSARLKQHSGTVQKC